MTHAHHNPTEALLERLRSGNLSAEEALALNDALEHLEEEEMPTLAPTDEVSGAGATPSFKMRLKRPVQEQMPLSAFERLCYKELEGELADAERQELDDITTRYPHYAQQREAILRTKLVVPTEIVYPYKERLKHTPTSVAWRPLLWKGLSVAACLFFVLWIGLQQLDRPLVPIADVARCLRTETPIDHQEAALHSHQDVPLGGRENEILQPHLAEVPTGHPDKIATDNQPVLAHQVEPQQTKHERVDNERLAPLPSLAVNAYATERLLALESRDPMPELYHDWEAIAAEEEVEAFENEVKSFQRQLRPERPLRTIFLDYVVQLASR